VPLTGARRAPTILEAQGLTNAERAGDGSAPQCKNEIA
jgi:hypothetical protein